MILLSPSEQRVCTSAQLGVNHTSANEARSGAVGKKKANGACLGDFWLSEIWDDALNERARKLGETSVGCGPFGLTSLAAVAADIFLCQGSQESLQRSQLSGLMEPGL